MSAQSGDNTAAFRLGRALTVCHETMRQVPNAATLDQILHVMRTAEPAQALAFERLNDACSRHQALTAAGIDWVTAAAEAGHAEAQLWYLPTAETYYEPATDEIRSWYRAKGIELWQAARDAGNLQATLNLSDWYRDIDPVAAVAHVELAERLMRALCRRHARA